MNTIIQKNINKLILKRGKTIRKDKKWKKWSKNEDKNLILQIAKTGEGSWDSKARSLFKAVGTEHRCGKQLLDRWYLHLKPGIDNTPLNLAEELMILGLHCKYGNDFIKFESQLQGRTCNSIKNYFNAKIKTIFLLIKTSRRTIKIEFDPVSIFRVLYFLHLIIYYLDIYTSKIIRKFPGVIGQFKTSLSIFRQIQEKGIELRDCETYYYTMATKFEGLSWGKEYIYPKSIKQLKDFITKISRNICSMTENGELSQNVEKRELELILKKLWLNNSEIKGKGREDMGKYMNMGAVNKGQPKEERKVDKKEDSKEISVGLNSPSIDNYEQKPSHLPQTNMPSIPSITPASFILPPFPTHAQIRMLNEKARQEISEGNNESIVAHNGGCPIVPNNLLREQSKSKPEGEQDMIEKSFLLKGIKVGNFAPPILTFPTRSSIPYMFIQYPYVGEYNPLGAGTGLINQYNIQ